MNILIITNVFHPITHIGAFRMNAFAKYLHLAGHNITVIAEGSEDKIAEWEGCDVHYVKDPIISQYTQHRYNNTIGKNYNGNKSVIRRVLKSIEYRITLNPSFFWHIKATNIAKRVLKHKQVDIVISTSSYDMSAHLCALKLRKARCKFFWIADFRDEKTYTSIRWHIKKLCLWQWERQQQAFLDNSDLILSVSTPLVNALKAASAHGNVLEIRNGYDYNEVYDCNFQEHFTMTYLGHFYKNIHPDYWFKAYTELINEKTLPADSLIKIIGNCEPIKIPEALRNNVIEIPQIPHDEAIRISIYETDVLVMIYSNTAKRKGVYSGKLLDYLATNKPIIAMYAPDDVVGELMKETNAGYAIRNDDIQSIKDAIIKCFHLWKNRESLPRNWDKIKEYRRIRQVGLLVDYIDKHLNTSVE